MKLIATIGTSAIWRMRSQKPAPSNDALPEVDHGGVRQTALLHQLPGIGRCPRPSTPGAAAPRARRWRGHDCRARGPPPGRAEPRSIPAGRVSGITMSRTTAAVARGQQLQVRPRALDVEPTEADVASKRALHRRAVRERVECAREVELDAAASGALGEQRHRPRDPRRRERGTRTDGPAAAGVGGDRSPRRAPRASPARCRSWRRSPRSRRGRWPRRRWSRETPPERPVCAPRRCRRRGRRSRPRLAAY